MKSIGRFNRCVMDVRLLQLVVLTLCVEVSQSRSAIISADGSSKVRAGSLLRSERWWLQKVPPDPKKPQPLAYTGTINPLTCFNTVENEVIPCFSFVEVKCLPWTSSTCNCDEKRPVCVTDVAKRSSPASPANARSSTKIQYACCPLPKKK